jgi:uncharacterized membrane protein
MSGKQKKRGFGVSIRNRIVSGILLLLPFAVTILVIRWLFDLVFKLINPVVVKVLGFVGQIPQIGAIPSTEISAIVTILTIFLILFFLYLVGSVARWVLVRRFVEAGEAILLKIPLVRTIYSATQQVVKAVSLPGKGSFKSVVLVEFPRPGYKAVGFLTGTLTDVQGRKFYKVFIPTTPNPTTGFFEIIPAEDVIETTLSVEDAFSMIISGGLVSPPNFQIPLSPRSAEHVQV